jgi:RNA polymerase sigma-70 factor (ECF subfamily)
MCARDVTGVVAASDGDLARAIASMPPGSADVAESELYRRFAPRVRLYGLRHLRNEEAARDLAQQVLWLTIERLRTGAVHDADQVASFILGTSRTMARDLRRREQRRDHLQQRFGERDVSQQPPFGDAVDLDRLDACLQRLADRDRQVLLLTFYAEKTAGEVGQALGLVEGHVRVIRHRALERLRQCVMPRTEVR